MKKQPLTKRQAEILQAIKDFNKQHGCMPTYAELAQLLNQRASGLFPTIRRMAEKGYIQQDRRPRRMKIL